MLEAWASLCQLWAEAGPHGAAGDSGGPGGRGAGAPPPRDVPRPHCPGGRGSSSCLPGPWGPRGARGDPHLLEAWGLLGVCLSSSGLHHQHVHGSAPGGPRQAQGTAQTAVGGHCTHTCCVPSVHADREQGLAAAVSGLGPRLAGGRGLAVLLPPPEPGSPPAARPGVSRQLEPPEEKQRLRRQRCWCVQARAGFLRSPSHGGGHHPHAGR